MIVTRVSEIISDKGYHFFEVTVREELHEYNRFKVIDKNIQGCERKRQQYIGLMEGKSESNKRKNN